MSWLWNQIAQTQYAYDCEMVDGEGKKDPGCTRRHEQGHHGIFERSDKHREKEWVSFLDHPINYTRSCASCNIKRVADPEKARDLRFQHQLERHGKAQTKAWLSKAPDEIKQRHEWKAYWKAVQ